MAQRTNITWDTCGDECIGIKVAEAQKCLAHSEEAKAIALRSIRETGAIDVRGVIMEPTLLEEVLGAARRGQSGELLIESCKFDLATCTGDAVFEGATFKGEALFKGVTFKGYALFDNATFAGDARFEKATFTCSAGFNDAMFTGTAFFFEAAFKDGASFIRATFRGADFHKAVLTGGAYFGGATFPPGVLFNKAIFTGEAAFAPVTFQGEALFSGATFSREAWFSGANFPGNAEFEKATFKGSAEFEKATFKGSARFKKATFKGSARFEEATFKGSARFEEATFTGNAGFEKATFVGDAEFQRATFSRATGFDKATFQGRALFEQAKFEQSRQFGPLLAYQALVLDEVQFMEPVQILVSSARVCCRRARFSSGVQFGLRWAQVVLDDTELAAPSILAGNPKFSSKELAAQEEQLAKAWQQDLASEVPGRPQLLSLRRADVAGLGLSNITATDCRFEGAHNLDKLRLESDVSFIIVPGRLRLGRRSLDWRQVIAEECAWRARPLHAVSSSSSDRGAGRRNWIAPTWPDWLKDEQPGVLEPRQIAGLYRALRKGREDIKDEPGAADFYYGEMEMRRHARPVDAKDHDGQSSATSAGREPTGRGTDKSKVGPVAPTGAGGEEDRPLDRTRTGWADGQGRVERGILTAYWLVSGYGLRAWRAVACFAVVVAVFAIGFYFAGFKVPPSPDSYWNSLLYAFRSTLSIIDNDVKLTAWGKLLQAVLRLTGPVLLGLALLALRGRVKR